MEGKLSWLGTMCQCLQSGDTKPPAALPPIQFLFWEYNLGTFSLFFSQMILAGIFLLEFGGSQLLDENFNSTCSTTHWLGALTQNSFWLQSCPCSRPAQCSANILRVKYRDMMGSFVKISVEYLFSLSRRFALFPGSEPELCCSANGYKCNK